MVDPSSVIGIVKFLQSLTAPFRWVTTKSQLIYFRIRTKWAWIDENKAILMAQHFLGGCVERAIPFQNFGSPRHFIAAFQKDSDEDYQSRIVLLEKIGGSLMVVWKSDDSGMLKSDSLHVEDVDRKGYKSISYAEESFGSGMGTRYLYVYSTENNQLSKIIENYNYSLAGSPDYFPEIETDQDEHQRKLLIDFAIRRGFLAEVELPDFDKPEYAVHRWHKENGNLTNGKVKIHRYPGDPTYGASVMDAADVGNTRWVAYFKGPLYKVDKKTNEFYIVYSPLNVYEWAKSLVGTENSVFFVCHCMSGLFLYDDKKQTLTKFCGYDNKPFETFETIDIGDQELVLSEFSNPENKVLVSDMNKLLPCRDWCKLNEPHLPNSCSYERYREELDLKKILSE